MGCWPNVGYAKNKYIPSVADEEIGMTGNIITVEQIRSVNSLKSLYEYCETYKLWGTYIVPRTKYEYCDVHEEGFPISIISGRNERNQEDCVRSIQELHPNGNYCMGPLKVYQDIVAGVCINIWSHLEQVNWRYRGDSTTTTSHELKQSNR